MKQTNLSIAFHLFVIISAFSLCSCKDTTTISSPKPDDQKESGNSAKNISQIEPVAIKVADEQPADAIVIATELKEAYQIRNKKHNLLLRPQNANKADGVPIVLYSAYPWKCLSWQFEKGQKDSYRLVNFFTSKTIQPAENHSDDFVPVVQATSDSQHPLTQYWFFIKLPGGLYKIVSANSNLALTAIDSAGGVQIYLAPFKDKDEQKWELEDLPEKLTM